MKLVTHMPPGRAAAVREVGQVVLDRYAYNSTQATDIALASTEYDMLLVMGLLNADANPALRNEVRTILSTLTPSHAKKSS